MPAADVHLGGAGYAEVWLNAVERLDLPAPRHGGRADGGAGAPLRAARRAVEWRALNQAARELLLAQASDWAFIMKTNTTVEYAKKRTRDHIARFDYLYRALTRQLHAGGADPAGVRGARQHLPGDRLPRLPLAGDEPARSGRRASAPGVRLDMSDVRRRLRRELVSRATAGAIAARGGPAILGGGAAPPR